MSSDPKKILLVDDDAVVRKLFSHVLNQAGYAVAEAVDGEDALKQVPAEAPALILLDVEMPRLNGWQTLAELRRRGCTLPVLMVTHVDDVDSRVQGLDAGADDYIGKSCELSELVARVRALLRRTPPRRLPMVMLRFGDVVVDLDKKVASCDGSQVKLTRSEFALLSCLSERLGTPVPREEIFAKVWGGKAGNSHTLDTHLWRLRKKLGDSDDRQWICSHAGIGYSLAPEVARKKDS